MEQVGQVGWERPAVPVERVATDVRTKELVVGAVAVVVDPVAGAVAAAAEAASPRGSCSTVSPSRSRVFHMSSRELPRVGVLLECRATVGLAEPRATGAWGRTTEQITRLGRTAVRAGRLLSVGAEPTDHCRTSFPSEGGVRDATWLGQDRTDACGRARVARSALGKAIPMGSAHQRLTSELESDLMD